MLIYFTALVMAALILFIHNHRNLVNRWAAFFLACAATGGLTEWLRDLGQLTLADFIQIFNLSFTPYAVLMFCLVYSERLINIHSLKWLKWVLLIPPAGMILHQQLSNSEYSVDYVLLLSWCAPYYLASCGLLVITAIKEIQPHKKRSELTTLIIMVPTLLAVLLVIYVGNVIWPGYDFFQMISVFIVYSLAAAVLCVFLYGVLGIRLRWERHPLEQTMQAFSSSTSLLNHTIKNELGKIALSTDNIRTVLAEDDQESRQQLEIISRSAGHMLEMVARMNSKLGEITLVEKPIPLLHFIEEAAQTYRQLLETRQIEVVFSYTCQPILWCDPVHLREVLGNLITNAAEAVSSQGTIALQLTEKKGFIVITVTDTGVGMDQHQLARVFEPFYSTKKSSNNYGLGLSYVYKVMQQSGGELEIQSEPGRGTKVSLYWTKRKLVK